MKIVSWNVNGIRAALRKGFWDWYQDFKPDVLCLQESKIQKKDFDSLIAEFNLISLDASTEQNTLFDFSAPQKKQQSIYCSLHTAEKAGYSGTLLLSRTKPISIQHGLPGNFKDTEGRTLTAEYEKFFLVNTYVPNVGRDLSRTDFKILYSDALLNHLQKLRKIKPQVIVCGDFNVAHTEMDIKNAKSNVKNAGFTPIERDWFTKFLNKNYIDIWRDQNPKTDNAYTWWSYRPGVREKNIGWRIDYFIVTPETKILVKKAGIHPDVLGSDHCPISLTLNKSLV